MKPNIIIVMTDQHRAGLRKAAGYPLDTMPFLDEWARRGVDFGRAYTSNPICMPARVSMFTGRYPSAHRVNTNYNGADAVYTEDILDVLKREGYKTALCGKNHTHRSPGDFDFCAEGSIVKNLSEQELNDEQALDSFISRLNTMEAHEPSPGGIKAQHPYRNVSSAFDFIDNAEGSPFFLWLSIAEPHCPYHVCEPYFSMFPPESLPDIETSHLNGAVKGWRYPWMRGIWEKLFGDEIVCST
jgi:arylsulfatase A-like enzyme